MATDKVGSHAATPAAPSQKHDRDTRNKQEKRLKHSLLYRNCHHCM
ncbi:Uncharacterized protein APZ42_004836 [Daphnia magna]|uniref:Uncharacterized protein n=1 Tax=Daphnia magna TaxID=35525 RepID=A0A162EZS9_9CRUS|nr:Uncharacterized protein APZ42_004836 [Daphnia magna]